VRSASGPYLLIIALLFTGEVLADDFVAAEVSLGGSTVADWFALPPPDQSDWSSKRIQKYATLHNYDIGEPQAVIRVPALEVAAPVYPDSQFMALEAGAAWVSTTAYPGNSGNAAIAGHRDSFFRPLEGIPLGTEIELVTESGVQTYAVRSVRIVDALDVSVLEPSAEAMLTLITCHPFRFQGYAPNRYIIQATLIGEPATESRSGLVDSAAISGRNTKNRKGDL
jgi:LPXTG-site transpeptidase (sortase) family protein